MIAAGHSDLLEYSHIQEIKLQVAGSHFFLKKESVSVLGGGGGTVERHNFLIL